MKRSLLMLGIVVGTLGIASHAGAQNYPWCAQYSGQMGGSMNCGFSSYAQCMADVSGVGGFCIANNTYVPPAGATPRQPARRYHAGNSY